MTLEEVDDSLPSGFHDARIQSVKLDYGRLVLDVELSVWLDDPDGSGRGRYSDGLLEFYDVAVFALEPPRPDSASRYPGAVDFSWQRESPESVGPELAGFVSSEHLAYSIFVQPWLSSIIVVARGVGFRWRDNPPAQ